MSDCGQGTNFKSDKIFSSGYIFIGALAALDVHKPAARAMFTRCEVEGGRQESS